MTDQQGHESGLEIDGQRYELPTFDSFDLDEAEILFEVAGVVQEQFAPLHPEEATDEDRARKTEAELRLIAKPSFKRALVHIAYRRRHPELSFDEINTRVGKVNALDVTMEFLRGDEDPPQSSPKPHEDKRSTSTPSRSEDSGKASRSISEARVVALSPTGTGG